MAGQILVVSLRADHSSIIPGEGKRRHEKLPAFFGTALFGTLPQPAIGGNTAGQYDFIAAMAFGRQGGFLPQNFADVAAETGSQIGRHQRLAFLFGIVRQIDDRRFQPREGEVKLAFGMRGGQRVGMGIALVLDGIQRHAPGIGQPHAAGGFIEGLACGIIGLAAPHKAEIAMYVLIGCMTIIAIFANVTAFARVNLCRRELTK